MSSKSLLCAAIAACAMLLPLSAHGGTAGTTVSITETVDSFAEWSNTAPTIAATDFTSHITDSTTPRTAVLHLTLYTNVTVTIAPTAGSNSGVLTSGNNPAQTLTTSYMLAGAGMDTLTRDSAFKPATAGAGGFFNASNNGYSVTHVSGTGSYAIDLTVQAVAPGSAAPDADDYTCSITLTASW